MPTRFAHDDAIWEDFWHPVIVRLPELGGVGLRCFNVAWCAGAHMATNETPIHRNDAALNAALQFEEGGFVPKVPAALVSVGFWPPDGAARRNAHVHVQVGEKVYVDAPAIAFAGGFRVGRIALPVGILVETRVNIHAGFRGEPDVYLCLGLSLPKRLA